MSLKYIMLKNILTSSVNSKQSKNLIYQVTQILMESISLLYFSIIELIYAVVQCYVTSAVSKLFA